MEIKDEGRQGTQWSEIEFGRNRWYNYLSADAPSTIAAKELGGDNAIDQVSDGKTNKAYIGIGEDFMSLTVMDGGKGISTRKTIRQDTGKESTYLFLNIAKMYTSTNYDDENSSGNASDTVGQNGLGSKISNFCSAHFTAGCISSHVKTAKQVISGVSEDCYTKSLHDAIYGTAENPASHAIYGYHFQQGHETIDGVNPMNQAIPELIKVNAPTFFDETEPYGYFVHAEFDKSILGDEIDVKWVENYIRTRVGECKLQDKDISVRFEFPVKDSDGKVQMKEIIFVKPVDYAAFIKEHKVDVESGHIEVIFGWEEMAEKIRVEHPEDVWGPFSYGALKLFYAKTPDLLEGIPNICQGALVNNPKVINVPFDVAGTSIKLPIPCVFKLSAKTSRGLTYKDQTKRELSVNSKTPPKINYIEAMKAGVKLKEQELVTTVDEQEVKIGPNPVTILEHFQRIANEKYLQKSNKGKFRSDFYWGATGGCTARELFSKELKTDEDYVKIFERIKSDPDAIKYAQENNIDLDAIEKEITLVK